MIVVASQWEWLGYGVGGAVGVTASHIKNNGSVVGYKKRSVRRNNRYVEVGSRVRVVWDEVSGAGFVEVTRKAGIVDICGFKKGPYKAVYHVEVSTDFVWCEWEVSVTSTKGDLPCSFWDGAQSPLPSR
jgi:hypothetical protein